MAIFGINGVDRANIPHSAFYTPRLEVTLMRIAGVDPGTIHAGVGIIDTSNRHLTLLFSGTIHAARHKLVSIRLELVYTELKAVFEKWQPDVVALENVFYHKNFQSAVKVGEARAAAMIAARSCGISVVEYPPARVKQSVCGNGCASKEQVQYMVRHLLNLHRPLDSDSADALAVALCYSNMRRFKSQQPPSSSPPGKNRGGGRKKVGGVGQEVIRVPLSSRNFS